jgi:hypothetical protein
MICAKKIWFRSLALKASYPKSCLRNVTSTKPTSKNWAKDLVFLERYFAKLAASIRAHFGVDPGQSLDLDIKFAQASLAQIIPTAVQFL